MLTQPQKKLAVERAYARYAWFYDWVFGASLQAGRRLAVTALDARPGQRILEIGVGTGLALELYAPGVQITGVDLSEPMLEKARARAARAGLNPDLRAMDAQALRFDDASFDHSVALYVASVAPDPVAVVREMRRVTRPGGRMVLLNHFSRRGAWTERVERVMQPLASLLGFEPLFHLDSFLQATGLERARVLPVPPLRYWQVLVAEHGA